MSKSVSEERPRSRIKIFLWTWAPAIVAALFMGALIYLPFTPWVQGVFDLNEWIWKYGDQWIFVFVPALLAFPEFIVSINRRKGNSGMWSWVVAAIVVETVVAAFLFLVLVIPNYSYIEYRDHYSDEPRYYFGRIMGDVASGQGRAFDKERRLLYRGGFDNNEYSGYGEQYAYNKEYGFKKGQGENMYLLYRGEFAGGSFSGSGTYWDDSQKGTGSFQGGRYNGYVEQWYLDGDTGETLLYKGYYWKGLRHGPGTIMREDGSVRNQGIFEKGYMTSGTYCTEDGTLQYFGQWSDDKRNGTGTLYHTNGNPSYYGGIVNGKREGYGTTYQSDGKTVDKEGWFIDNEYYGPEPPGDANSAGGGGNNIVLDGE